MGKYATILKKAANSTYSEMIKIQDYKVRLHIRATRSRWKLQPHRLRISRWQL